MRFKSAVRCLIFLACLLFALSIKADEPLHELFNGRDLSGWDGDPRLWTVEDGLLTGTTTAEHSIDQNTFAIWTGGEIGDFELKVVFRMSGNNNSGVQYRSERISGRKWGIRGYQADIHLLPNYAGMLYEEEGRKIMAETGQCVAINADNSKVVSQPAKKPASPDFRNWSEMEIKAKGNHLIHKLNGQLTADVTDYHPQHARSSGLLALQLHAGPPMKVQFKSIVLKRTESGKSKDIVGEKTSEKRAGLGSRATQPDRIRLADGFRIELLHDVPRDREGSWINLCVDPQGRLIVAAENGTLYRLTIPPKDQNGSLIIERIPVDVGQAHGLLCAFDSLYVVRNGNPKDKPNGLYRVRDKDGNGQYDSAELLRALAGDDDHGPHAVLLAPDGKSLNVVCGNKTHLTELAQSRVPRIWDEDQLLPRIYGIGYMRGTPAPGGCIYRTDPDGKEWELVSSGFRNTFDAAYNADGELFTYDSDMEFDWGTPWYRPTRVCHVVSGVDWGWRNGSAKWPTYFADTLPTVVNIGPGSPTGMTFGYGSHFPAKYQRSLFLCDWTYGTIYAAHLEPNGATYEGTLENFVTASPLPLTDVVVNPNDGAMYFVTGGRGCQSGLYRVTYAGSESTEAVDSKTPRQAERQVRRNLAEEHVHAKEGALDRAWKRLKDPDRFVRHAARTVLEQQPLENWRDRALAERDPQASITALLALVRKIPRKFKPTGLDLDTPPPTFPANDAQRNPLEKSVVAALQQIDPMNLSVEQTLEMLRVYVLTFYRLGPPSELDRELIIQRLDRLYPAKDRETNAMLTEALCYLQADSAAKKGTRLLADAKTQEGQLDIARSLRLLRRGWTVKEHRQFFEWIWRAQAYKGGVNFQMFISEIKSDALLGLTESERTTLADIINAPMPTDTTALDAKPRPFVKEWTMEDLLPAVEAKLKSRDFDHGRKMFAAAKCFVCHRFANDGGAFGPDLTVLSGRFSPKEILESVLDPDKVISDQYAAVNILTTDGKTITGRIVNYSGGQIHVNTNMLDPLAVTKCNQTDVDEISKSRLSMMPKGLLNTLHEDDILDLMAFLMSRGEKDNAMFSPSQEPSQRSRKH
jgi:putative heme-binding domain-containing protein